MSDISTRLRDAVDDGPPLRTDVPELLGRARRSRSRRRIVTVLTAAAVVASTLGVAQLLPGDRDGVQPAAQRADALPGGEIARRCAPQLDKYAVFPGYGGFAGIGPEELLLVHPERRYAVGDVVALTTTDRAQRVLCLVPAKGDEHDPVGFSAFEPAAGDTELIRAVCSEVYAAHDHPAVTVEELRRYLARHGVPPFTQTPDLRDAQVRAVARNGSQLAAALELDGEVFACALAPATPAQSSVHRADGGGLDESFSTSDGAQWYRGAGRLPDAAAAIEYRVQGFGVRRYEVVDGGWYAFVRGIRSLVDWPPTSYRILDAAGRELAVGHG